VLLMPTVKNTTDEHVCIQTGKGSFDYVQYHLYPKGSKRKDQPDTLTVTEEEAKLIVKRIKAVKIAGITVSRHLKKPLRKVKKKAKGEEASSEIN